jgi:hypothetical protein
MELVCICRKSGAATNGPLSNRKSPNGVGWCVPFLAPVCILLTRGPEIVEPNRPELNLAGPGSMDALFVDWQSVASTPKARGFQFSGIQFQSKPSALKLLSIGFDGSWLPRFIGSYPGSVKIMLPSPDETWPTTAAAFWVSSIPFQFVEY